MVFKDLCILVLWMKVVSALKGLNRGFGSRSLNLVQFLPVSHGISTGFWVNITFACYGGLGQYSIDKSCTHIKPYGIKEQGNNRLWVFYGPGDLH